MRTCAAILAVGEDRFSGSSPVGLLSAAGYLVSAVRGWKEGLRVLRREAFDLIVLDTESRSRLPLRLLRSLQPDMEVVLLTPFACLQEAAEATREGAFAFLVKPFRDGELLLAVRNGLERRRLRMENQSLRSTMIRTPPIEGLLGRSEAVCRVLQMTQKLAPLDSPVLVTGEKGTGKKFVARALHDLGHRADGPFVAAASRQEIQAWLETGQTHQPLDTQDLPGALEHPRRPCGGGTLFLQELEHLPERLQRQVLDAVEMQVSRLERRRDAPLSSAPRLVFALDDSSPGLPRKPVMPCQQMRELLRTAHLHIPALRERREDIPRLVTHFLGRNSSSRQGQAVLNPDAMRALIDYDWPGNTEELNLVLELAASLAFPEQRISSDFLPRHVVESGRKGFQPARMFESSRSLKEMVASFERDVIREALERNDWNQRQTALLLRTIPTTLNQKIKRLHIRSHLRTPDSGSD